jgi:hypothetical protein
VAEDDRRIPPVSPIVELLLREDSAETKDVMALVGFVGPGRGSDVRLYPDIDLQRWMDIPLEAIVAHRPLDDINSSRRGRTIVWVRRDAMFERVFKQGVLTEQAFADLFEGSWISTWPLLPETRLVAAELLDLVPHLAYSHKDT